MNRRLYFLMPDKAHALSVIYELTSNGIDVDHIHALADKKVRLKGLPNASWHQSHDTGHRVEDLLWKINLFVFGLALGSLATLLLSKGLNAWLLVPSGIMLVTFLVGLLFTRVPNTRLGEFRDALAHGEILLMVDVPQTRAADIEDRVRHHHPETTVGGVGWGTEALGL